MTIYLLPIPLAVLLVAGFTSMWLAWLFQGSVRQAIVAAMPESWRAGASRREILRMLPDDLHMFICGVSDMPPFLRGVLTCELCSSAYVSLLATLMTAPLLPSVWVLPLVWASGAWIANKIRTQFK